MRLKLAVVALFAVMALTLALTPVTLAQTPTPAAVTCEQDYTVQAGDWLSTIAQAQYNDVTAYWAIYVATNQKAQSDSTYATIADPNAIEVGSKLCLPAAADIASFGTPPATVAPSATVTATATVTPSVSVTPTVSAGTQVSPTQEVSPTVPTTTTTGTGGGAPSLTGGVWKWFESSTATERISVARPSLYTVQFNADGTVAVKADCNTGTGNYTVSGASLTLAPLTLTLVACGEASLGNDFVTLLGQAASYSFEGNNLVVALQGGGSMAFIQ